MGSRALVVATWTATFAAVVALEAAVGPGAAALWLVPALVTGWFGRWRGALIAALLAPALEAVVRAFLGESVAVLVTISWLVIAAGGFGAAFAAQVVAVGKSDKDRLAAALETLQAREKLLAREQHRFGLLAGTIEEVFWLFRAAPPEVLYVNQAYDRVLGRDQGRLAADPMDWLNAFPAAGRPAALAAMEEATQGTAEVVLPVRAGDGERMVHMVMRRVDGDDHLIAGTIRDVTAEHRAKQALIEQQVAFRALAERSPDMIVRRHRDGRILYANQAVRDRLARAGVEAHDRGHDRLVPPEAQEEYERVLRDAFEKGVPGCVDIHEGGDYEMRVVPEDGEDGAVETVLIVTHDVTRIKRAEDEVRAAKERLESVIAASPTPIATFDEAGDVESWNPSAERLFGWMSDEVVGRPLPAAARAPDDAFDDIEQVLKGEVIHREVERPCKDGSTVPVLLHAAPLQDHTGRNVGAVALMVDLRERRAAEKAREQAAEHRLQLAKLRDIDHFRTTFMNTAAHELSTPLTPIRLQLTMMREDSPPPGLDIIERNIERLQVLVKDLLDSTRLQAGRLSMRPTDLDLNDVVRDVVATMGQRLGDRVQVHGDQVFLQGDATRLAQVGYNLLENAAKYGGDGPVEVRVSQEGDDAVLTVRDHGLGMDAAALGSVFEPFAQFHRDEVTEPGTGLGLFVAKGIVEMHGGTITAESRGRGKGTTVTVRLPARSHQDKGPHPVLPQRRS